MAQTKGPQQSQEDELLGCHAFVDRSGRFPLDEKMRAMGYAIHSRPKGGVPTWRDTATNKVHSQEELVARHQLKV